MNSPISSPRRAWPGQVRAATRVWFGRRVDFWRGITYRQVSIAFFALFVLIFFLLMSRRHEAFNTQALDLAKFDQAIWNTLQGRFLFSSVQNFTILANHFSPFMALLSPLFLIWSDVRVLFLAQTVGLGIAGLILAQIVRRQHPSLAIWFLLAFYLNPALHEVALVEFHRVTLAVPFLAIAMYGLYTDRRWLMAGGLALALLCKEDISLIVIMVGVYLLVRKRDWRWGLPLIGIGAVWAVGVTFWLIPSLNTSSAGSSLYPQLNYFGLSGNSYADILRGALSSLTTWLRRMLDAEAILAIGRILLPVGLVLPFLAADWLLLVAPYVCLMLMSEAPGMHRLEDWYMAAVLPVLFAAIATGLGRLPARRAHWCMGGLVGATLIGYVWFSHAPLGGKYQPQLYQVTEHHRLAARVIQMIPANARVAAQDPYVPHLSHREHIYLYPWVSIGEENLDYVILDRQLHPYPLQPAEMQAKIDDLLADPSYRVEIEVDDIYVFRRLQRPFMVNRVAAGTMLLRSVEVAVADEQKILRPVGQSPVQVRPGQQVRVSLYWLALDAPAAERSVSVRIADVSGALVAQQDNWPGQGKKPTSWWEKGWQIRDVYYMTISSQAQPGPASLDVVLYDSFSHEIVPFGRDEVLHLCDVVIIP